MKDSTTAAGAGTPAAAPVSAEPSRVVVKEFLLPSGRTARKIKTTGRDVINAFRVAQLGVDGEVDNYQILVAFIAHAVTIDGRRVPPEELLDGDGEDLLVLIGEVGASFFTALQGPGSPAPSAR